jgi:hypothetical protein
MICVFKSDTILTFYETFQALLSKIGSSAAFMAALRAGANTDKSRSQYANFLPIPAEWDDFRYLEF